MVERGMVSMGEALIKGQDFTDQRLTCVDCNEEFRWSAGEQAFYANNNFSPPKRCHSCRAAMKARLAAVPESERWQDEFDIICATCGAEATVRFRPTKDRPVYCQKCYRAQRVAQ